MLAVCTLCGDQSAHAIVFRASLTIGGKENHSGARMDKVATRRLTACHLREGVRPCRLSRLFSFRRAFLSDRVHFRGSRFELRYRADEVDREAVSTDANNHSRMHGV